MRRQVNDLSGADYSINESLENMLNAESTAAYKRPWHRLDRGLRLNRLRAFVETLASSRGLTPPEQASLLQLLTRALDRKILNSKTSVTFLTGDNFNDSKVKEKSHIYSDVEL